MVRPEIAVLRFGLGARPGDLAAAAADPREWLRSQLKGPVPLAGTTPLAPSDQIVTAVLAARQQQRQLKRDAATPTPGTTAVNPLREAYQLHYRAQVLARAQSAALSSRPFAERLVHFWANHFAISADKGVVYGLAGTVENEAIRPHVNGRFIELLTAVEQHPAMIAFLDNQFSVGAESSLAQRANRRAARAADLNFGDAAADPAKPRRVFGINENLAREILELHTLGVGGGYTQQDVTSFAQILTGWSIGGGRLAGGDAGRFYFRDNVHEPGSKLFMGKRYAEDGQAQGEAVLQELARQRATARFIATKLTRHFVSDDPPPATVDRVAHAFLTSDGDLPQVYAALVASPEAWDPNIRKFKTPEDFVFSALRALELVPQDATEVIRSFDLLGQRQYTPGSPAGWPDTAPNWDGADALTHRIAWASRVAERYDKSANPRDLAHAALGEYARPETLTSLQRAASGSQAVALLLMSPEFQRR